MARRKHAVALFEVIHKDKRYARKVSPSAAFKTPLWWFKRRPATVMPTPVELKAEPVEAVAEIPAANCRQEPSPVDHPLPAKRRAIGQTIIPLARAKWENIKAQLEYQFDRRKGVIVGVSAALAVCGGISLARWIHPSSPAKNSTLAYSTDAIRQGPAHPEVLNVGAIQHSGGTLVRTPAPASPSSEQVTNASVIIPAAPARQINLNYMLVQSYPDEKSANEALAFLNKNGVACTIERSIKNWRKDFYLVVGLDGFTRISGPDYDAYRKRIDVLSAQFVKEKHKAFAPQAIKWDRSN